MKKNLFVVVSAWATLSVATVPALAEGDIAAGAVKSATCVPCHMADGNSVAPIWPKLAGQSASYMVKQLKDLKAKRREDPTMGPQAALLTEQEMRDLAAYFSTQVIAPGSSNQPALLNAGEQLYRKGRIKARIIACTGCHGQNGKGNHGLLQSIGASPVAEAPAIGGQHAMYVVKQIKAFRDGTRTNDVGKTMHNLAKEMSDDEIAAVAEYITNLR